MSKFIGDFVIIRVTVKDKDGQLVDPDFLPLKIVQPSSGDIDKVKGDFTRISQGVYEYYHQIADSGDHLVDVLPNTPSSNAAKRAKSEFISHAGE